MSRIQCRDGRGLSPLVVDRYDTNKDGGIDMSELARACAAFIQEAQEQEAPVSDCNQCSLASTSLMNVCCETEYLIVNSDCRAVNESLALISCAVQPAASPSGPSSPKVSQHCVIISSHHCVVCSGVHQTPGPVHKVLSAPLEMDVLETGVL